MDKETVEMIMEMNLVGSPREPRFRELLAEGWEPDLAADVLIKQSESLDELYEGLRLLVLGAVIKQDEGLPPMALIQRRYYRYFEKHAGTSNLMEVLAKRPLKTHGLKPIKVGGKGALRLTWDVDLYEGSQNLGS